MIKLIVFDFDGVIENTYEENYQLSRKEIKDLTREEHKKLFDGNVKEELQKFNNRKTDFDFKKYSNKHKLKLKINEEVKQELKKLSKSYVLGIITSSGEEITNQYLKNNKITKLFAFAYGSDTHKLKEEKFKLVIEKFNLKKDEIIFITDTLGDILEANKIGIKTIGVDFGYHERERLEKGKPYKICSNLNQISKIIKEIK